MKIKFYAATLFSLCASILLCRAQDIAPSTTMVYPGMEGKLIYTADSLGNRIPDFSNAGFKGGGVAIPYVPNKVTVWPVVGDCSVVIQAAIDKVSAMPLDAQGFRGAVLIKQGTYPLDKPLFIKASGVVLRGEGTTEIGTILFGRTVTPRPAGNAGSSLINIAGENGTAVQEATKQTVTDKYVPVGARSLSVTAAKGFKLGDKVLVRRYGNQEWIKEIGLDSATVGNSKRWRPFVITYDRIITAISGNTITVDAPIFTAIETKWGGGDVLKYDDSRIENIGVENIRGISEYNPTVRTSQYYNMDRPDNKPTAAYKGEEYFSDENHYRNLVTISNAKNVWVRNMSAYHFVNSVVQTDRGTKWVTIQDVESWEPVSVRQGARRFIYHLQGQLALVQRCFSQKGRHSFVLQGSEASGNVFFDCKAVNPYSTSEPHNKWVNGILYDNVKAPLTARFWDYIIGWAGANIVMWNCEGDFLIQSPPTAKNYSFGHIGTASVIYNAPLQDLTKPRGYIESLDRKVAPKSLYLTQLKERLGAEAVSNTILNTLDTSQFKF